MRSEDMTYADWKRAEKEYNLRKETEQFEMEPWWYDVMQIISVLVIAVCLGFIYVMIVSIMHGY